MGRTLYTALIGINAYEKLNPLRGCMQDILRIDGILEQLCTQAKPSLAYKPAFLLAPHAAEEAVVTAYLKARNETYIPPTFAHITQNAFAHLQQAGNDDIVLLYYSGHGCYVPAPASCNTGEGLQQFETLMPVDARTTGRPIVDKELAWLLHKTLAGKPKLHAVVIMDCCHSGSNSREPVKLSTISYRQADPDGTTIDISQWLGYDEGFFQITDGRLQFPIARYVHLAACASHQKAADHPMGGMFSRALAAWLTAHGNTQSYRRMMQQIAVDIAVNNGQQNPVAFAMQDTDLDEPFLGGNLLQHLPENSVKWLGETEGWCLMTGSMQGIAASNASRKTLVRITGIKDLAEVKAVSLQRSALAGKGLLKLDTEKSYSAQLVQLAGTLTVVGLQQLLQQHTVLAKALKEVYKTNLMLYSKLDAAAASPDYLAAIADVDREEHYALVSPQSERPLFKPQKDAAIFAAQADAVGKWRAVRQLQPALAAFAEDDFLFETEIITGEKITGATLNKAKGKKQSITSGDTLSMPYKNGHQPAFRFTIRLQPNATINRCYIQALYFDHLFGINTQYLPADTAALQKGGSLSLSFPFEQYRFAAIPVGLGKNYKEAGVTEAFHLLKILVSTDAAIDIGRYAQPALEASAQQNIRTRDGSTRSAEKPVDTALQQMTEGWAAFDFFLHITTAAP